MPSAERWKDPKEFLGEWDERTKLIGQLVPSNSRVLEFGAGRRQLPQYLPHDCEYIGSDLIDRGPDTIVLDLNDRPLPDLRHTGADVAVFGGVLEYIYDLPSLVNWLGQQFACCILSYECSQTRHTDAGRSAEVRRRREIGWANTYHDSELREMFGNAGFLLKQTEIWHTRDGDEPVFVFERVSDCPFYRAV